MKNNNEVYNRIIIGLSTALINKYGNLSKAADALGVDRPHLNKVANKKRALGLVLYIKIINNLFDLKVSYQDTGLNNMSLVDFLQLDASKIHLSVNFLLCQ